MTDTALFSIVLLMSIIATALGYAISSLKSRHQIDSLRQKYADLNDKLDSQKTTTSVKFSNVEKMREGLQLSLSSLAGDMETPPDLSDKERFVEAMLTPLHESLNSADQQVKRINNETKKAQQQIQKQLDLLSAPLQLGRGNIKQVGKALSDSEARRQWGMQAIKELLELTYMTDHYRLSRTAADETDNQGERKYNKQTPPCMIHLPDGSQIAIDINAPLEAYINICTSPDKSVRAWHLETHARKLRDRILEMISSTYQAQFNTQPRIQALMILNDDYLNAALEADDDLLSLALNNNLILATPTDLYTLLQTISIAWRQQDFAADAHKIRETGVTLYQRFDAFIKLIAELGSELTGVLDSYNRAVSLFGTKPASAEQQPKTGNKIQAPAQPEESDESPVATDAGESIEHSKKSA